MQDRFIASLELPTYHNFKSYQFLDVLEALSFRLMVLDHISKLYEERMQQQIEAGQDGEVPLELDERAARIKMEKEVNRLIFQKQSENIVAFQELWAK